MQATSIRLTPAQMRLALGIHLLVIAVVVALSLVSLIVVVQGAEDEPYGQYRRADAILQVGVGSALMALWAAGAVLVIGLVVTRCVPAAWLVLVLWAAFCLFMLSYSPIGYLQDLEQHVLSAK